MQSIYRICGLALVLCVLAACRENEKNDPEPTANPNPEVQVTVGEALVFEYPSRDAAVLFRLIEGDRRPILAQTTADLIGVVWYQVNEGEKFGWLAGSQVEISGDLSAVRRVDFSQETPSPIALSSTPPTTPDTPTPSSPQIVVSAQEAIILDAPQPEAAELARLALGETADLLGRLEAEAGTFYFLGQGGDVLGWVSGADVTVAGDITSVPILEDVDESLSELLPTEVALAPSDTPEAELTETAEAPDPTAVRTIPTLPPTATPRQSPTPTADYGSAALNAPTATPFGETETSETVEAVETSEIPPTPPSELQPGEPPPLEITLPEGWQAAYVLVPINTSSLMGQLPVALYQGPLEGDMTGSIWVVWGFPNIASPSGEINLYGDGVQLLRGMVLDSLTCNIGLGTEPGDPPAQFKIGGLDAIGSIYSAVDCEESNDIAGFFAVLQQGGGNFAFFAGVEPVESVREGLPQLEAILSTVEFQAAE